MNLETDKLPKLTDANTDTFNSKNHMKPLVEEEEQKILYNKLFLFILYYLFKYI